MIQELSRVTGIFTGNEFHFAQHSDCPMSSIFQIANRRCHEEKRSSHAGYSVIKLETSKCDPGVLRLATPWQTGKSLGPADAETRLLRLFAS